MPFGKKNRNVSKSIFKITEWSISSAFGNFWTPDTIALALQK